MSRSRLELSLSLILLTLTLQFLLSPVDGVFDDNLPADDLYIHGDLVLGALVRLRWTEEGKQCGKRLARPGVQVAAAMQYAINEINRDSSILPGFTLGLALMNDCDRPSVALARAAKFAPLKPCVGCYKNKQCTPMRDEVPPSYKVVGVMGPYSSPMSMAVASFLGLYEIPIVSWSATSPELSGEKQRKFRYKYFARTVPSDEQLIEAIVALLKELDWNYVSLLSEEGSHASVVLFKRFSKRAKICIAIEQELNIDDSEQDYDDLIETLLGSPKFRKPTVIVALLNGKISEQLLLAMDRNNATQRFVFIGNDGFQPKLANEVKKVLPIKAINFEMRNSDPPFEAYYRDTSPFRDQKNGWVGEYTKEELNCTTNRGELNEKLDCDMFKTLGDVSDYQLFNGIARATAIVKTYAIALHRLIMDQCPEVKEARDDKRKIGLDECINGSLLFGYITNTSFNHHGWWVEFDNKGDVYGDYIATLTFGEDEAEYAKMLAERSRVQLENRIKLNTEPKNARYHQVDFGEWTRKHQELTIDWDLLPWQPESYNSSIHNQSSRPIPKSICSDPCQPGERRERLDMACCWECKKCRPNERVIKNQTKCEACDINEWPTEDFRNCEEIEPTYLPYSALDISITLTICALFGLASVGVITGLFIKHWERRVIKGCTRELMVPIMIGLILSYVTVILSLVPPSVPICYISYIGFHISLCLLFGPLFLKTHRVYMIFRASDRCKTRVKLADSKALLMGLMLVVGVQVALIVLVICVAHFVEDPIDTTLIQPSLLIKMVQKCCHFSAWVILVPLGYNILLLILCAIYGWHTRKLPENYNESWYIFIAVITSIFVCIACIPPYFVVEQANNKVALLTLALIVNGLVISTVLFCPKIYAVYNVPERDIRISRLGSRRLSMAVGENETMNNRSR